MFSHQTPTKRFTKLVKTNKKQGYLCKTARKMKKDVWENCRGKPRRKNRPNFIDSSLEEEKKKEEGIFL
jgi:hypothetical protein